MGNGDFNPQQYSQARAARQSRNEDDFAYSRVATRVHESLLPSRIRHKIHGVLESRDSAEHPESTPIILTFDVTGSNLRNAQVVQTDLPALMGKLKAVVQNPQLGIWANDDVKAACGINAIQISEFESDNRIDEAIRHVWLTGDGGGNGGESYDLLLFAASRLVVTDAFERRGKKGHLLLYADEMFRTVVMRREVKLIFDMDIEADIPIEEMIQECRQKWNISILWPYQGFTGARGQYEALFGPENVHIVESPSTLCDTAVAIVAAAERNSVAELATIADNDFSNRSA